MSRKRYRSRRPQKVKVCVDLCHVKPESQNKQDGLRFSRKAAAGRFWVGVLIGYALGGLLVVAACVWHFMARC